MQVEEIMSTKVWSAHPDTLISDVAVTMCFNKISGVPVLDDDDNIVGMLSEKDILRAMYPDISEIMDGTRIDFEELEKEYRDVINHKVSDLMSTHVHTVSPQDPVLRAVSVMCVNKIRRIPVAKDGKLIGIISIGDVHKAIFQNNITKNLHSKQSTTAHAA